VELSFFALGICAICVICGYPLLGREGREKARLPLLEHPPRRSIIKERREYAKLSETWKSFRRGKLMAQKIVEAIIEDGQLKYVGDRLPKGRLNVHLVYDIGEDSAGDQAAEAVIAETAGIYKDLDVGREAKALRMEWERRSFLRR
jgi:hypothetical protein